MKLTYEQIRTKPKILQSVTTLNREEFEELSEFLDKSWRSYIQRYTLEGKPRNRMSTIRSNTVLRTAEDRLLFILYHLKGNVLQELMAITFEMTQPQVSVWIKIISKLLREALEKQGFLPARNVARLKQLLEKESTVILDGVEREIQRPKDDEVQKEYYSGKKNVMLSRTT